MSESYEVGTRAWQPDPNEGWVPSEVEEKIVSGDKVKLVFRLENGDVSVL
jgi:myosin-5